MKTIPALILALVAALAVAACGDDDDDATPTPAGSPTAAATETADPNATETPIGSQPATSCPVNPDPADVTEVAIAAPRPDSVVTSPLTVEGKASAFEATIQITLLDADGNELYDDFAMTNEGQTLAPYSVEVEFDVEENTPGCLQVYMLSGEDGSPVSIAQVPLVFAP